MSVIDRGVETASKIDAYSVPCDRVVDGENLAVNVSAALRPYLLSLTAIAMTIGIRWNK